VALVEQLNGLMIAIFEGLKAPEIQQVLDAPEAEKAKLEQQPSPPKPTLGRVV
jgi:hypothetical protein